jgi:hypothetical protein
LAFWGTVGESFDAREARRAFTWINAVGMAGAIVGGFAAQVAAKALGAVWLLAVGALWLSLGAVAFRFSKVEALATSVRSRMASARAVVRVPYAALLAILMLSVSLIQQLTDFVFRQRAAQLGEAEMAGFFAAQQLWTGVFCVAFQFLAGEALLRRWGILRYVAVIPSVTALLAMLSAAWPSVWAVWALKLFESAASWSLFPVAFQLLYAPLPDDIRDGVRRTIDGLLRKVGMGVAGVFLLGVAPWLGMNGVVVSIVLVCAGALVVLGAIRPKYLEALHLRVAGAGTSSLVLEESLLLSEGLRSPVPERVMRAAELLTYAHALDESHLRLLLAHSHERVQTQGILLAEGMNVASVAKQLEGLALSNERRPRDAAVWALAKVAPERARQVLPGFLASDDIGLVITTTGGLLSLAGQRDPRAVAMFERLLQRGPSAPPQERRAMARLLGRVGVRDATSATTLAKYLDDADASVRKEAMAAAGEGLFFDLAPRLLRFLSWRDERSAARDALVAMGDHVVSLVATTLDDRTFALSLRLQLPRLLHRIGTQAAFDALLQSNARDDAALHYRVGGSLVRLRDEHPDFSVDVERVHDALERRRQTRDRLFPMAVAFKAALGEASLLTRIVNDRLDQAFELSFWLFGLLHDSRTMRRIHAHVREGDSKRRAWALELLENVLTEREYAFVSKAIEVPHWRAPLGEGRTAASFIEPLCDSDDFTLRACARRVARQRGLYSLAPKEDDMSEVTVKNLFALEGVEIFAQSDVDDLAAVASVAKEHVFRKGERIYAEGDPGDALYVIVEGAVEARREGEVVLTMRSRESFGETSLFDGAPRINEVIATQDTTALVIDRRDFLDLLSDRPELLAGMFRVMSRQLKTMVVEVAARRSTTGDVPAVAPVLVKSETVRRVP